MSGRDDFLDVKKRKEYVLRFLAYRHTRRIDDANNVKTRIDDACNIVVFYHGRTFACAYTTSAE
jgi:hypothetical protein